MCVQRFFANSTTFQCQACPTNTTNAGPGATSVTSCTICTNGTYGTGPSTCTACPTNAQVPAGTVRPTTIVDCICKPGFYKYSPPTLVPAVYSCVALCPANTYVGSDGITCTACPSSTSGFIFTSTNPQPSKISYCICPGGSYWDASGASPTCTKCGTNAITIANGNTQLTVCACPANTYGNPAPNKPTAPNLNGCMFCPSSPVATRPGISTADTTSLGCTCPFGYFWAAGTPGSCTPCATGANTTVAGATSSSQCGCPANTYGTPTGTGTCTRCGATGVEGTRAGLSTTITYLTDCICSKDYYQDTASGFCATCPTGAVTSSVGAWAKSACGCPANYFGNGGAGGCAQCPTGSTTPWTSISYDDTSATTATFACVCPKNTYFQITTAGTASAPPVAACTACAKNAITQAAGATRATLCGCPDNFYGNPAPGGAGCLACPANGTRSGFSNVDTTATGCTCAKGFYWVASSGLCIRCPSLATTNTFGSTANTDCGCPANFYSSTNTPATTGCQTCPANSFRTVATAGSTVDTSASTAITANPTLIRSCTCVANFYWNWQSLVCTRCPTNSITDPATPTVGGNGLFTGQTIGTNPAATSACGGWPALAAAGNQKAAVLVSEHA